MGSQGDLDRPDQGPARPARRDAAGLGQGFEGDDRLVQVDQFLVHRSSQRECFCFFILVDERVFSPSRILLTPLFSRSMQFLVSSWESYILTKTGGAFLPPPPVAKILPAPIKAPTIVAKVSS